MLAEHFLAKDPKSAPLKAPPFHAETILMLATGWTWPELMATPEPIIEETMLYHNIKAEARAANGN